MRLNINEIETEIYGTRRNINNLRLNPYIKRG